MSQNNVNGNPWRQLAVFGLAGIDIAVCVTGGFFVGKWLAGWLGSSIWLVVGLVTGLIAGILNTVFLIKKFMEDING